MSDFVCKKCGACCKNVNRWYAYLPKYEKLLGIKLVFPYKHVNGICEMLDVDNTCKVYNSRPLVCNTMEMCKLYMQSLKMSENTFFKLQELSCSINRFNLNN